MNRFPHCPPAAIVPTAHGLSSVGPSRRRLGAGVAERTQRRVADPFASDFSNADAVLICLLPAINRQVRPLLWRQLREGTRVVSQAFDMGGEWPPQQSVGVGLRTVYAWTVDARVKALAQRATR